MGKKSLQEVILKNSSSIISVLGLGCDSNPSNYFIVINNLKPLLDVASKTFPLPNVGGYKGINDCDEEVFSSLEQMNFIKRNGSFYGLTPVGVDLMNAYHKSIDSNFKTSADLTKLLLDSSKNF